MVEKFLEVDAQVVPDVAEDDFAAALKGMQDKLAASPAFEEVNSFESSVAAETMRDAVLAILASFVAIVIYIWFRFENIYFGLAGLLALGHDVLVTAGSIAIAAYLSGTPIGPILLLDDFKFNLTLVASLLSIVGYALNDTVVIFDRIREIRGKNPHVTYEMINHGVNETLSRSIMTALTTLIVVVILYVFGGDGIHGFAFANIIGTIASCYSTVYIANPVLLWLVSREKKPAAVKPAATAAAAL
jgi:SecD/SecF fusion protein